MPCPNGQIQAGMNPQTGQPICLPSEATGNMQTGATRGQWWSQVLTSVPDILGGIADIVGASKGKQTPDMVVVENPTPPPNPKANQSIGWIILAVVVIAVVGLGVFLKKRS